MHPRNTECERLEPNVPVNPKSVALLESLINDRVMDLQAISEVVKSDPGLKAHVVFAVQDSDESSTPTPTVEECVIELGREGMRECIRAIRTTQLAKAAHAG